MMKQKRAIRSARSNAAAVAAHCLVVASGFLVLVSFSVSLVSAADWIKLGATRERAESYYDSESITRDGDIVSVRIKTSPAEETARYFLLRLNCPGSTFSISEPIGKEDPGEQGRAHKFTPWEVNYPGSLADGLRDRVCKKKIKQK